MVGKNVYFVAEAVSMITRLLFQEVFSLDRTFSSFFAHLVSYLTFILTFRLALFLVSVFCFSFSLFQIAEAQSRRILSASGNRRHLDSTSKKERTKKEEEKERFRSHWSFKTSIWRRKIIFEKRS